MHRSVVVWDRSDLLQVEMIANRKHRLTVADLFIIYDRLSVSPGPLADNDAASHGVAGCYPRHDGSIGAISSLRKNRLKVKESRFRQDIG